MQKLFAIIALSLAFIVPAYAEVPPAKIITVDVQKIIKESTAAQDIRKQLDSQRDKYQSEIKKEEDRLRATEQEIVKSQSKLTKEELTDKQKKLRDDFRAMEVKVDQRRKALDSAYAQGMDKIHDVLNDIIIAEAKAQGANFVLPKGTTMWHAPELEVTDSALKALNAKLPSVKVTIVDAPAKSDTSKSK